MFFRLMKEDVIVITGASSGIGAACARHLATCYSDLVLIGRNSGRLEEVSHDVTLAGATPYPKVVDLTDYKAVKNLATGIVEQLGKIRAVVHSAGEIRPIGLMGQVTSPDWIAGFRSNAEATFNCVKAFVDYSIMQEVSVFIGITSYADRYITSGESQYSAGKAAMSQILRYAQHELLNLHHPRMAL
jgi:NADP-dependent 3-hydroxy acid dehydrogenase YdfG